jgi:xanthine dehydrogenase iron-sulfur cluster and FAD-binding subunit A
LETLIDLKDMNLSYIKDDGDDFLIGAMTSAYDLFTHEALPESLKVASDKIGDIPLLHAVTIGGNLAILYHWVDLPPMLWALNAVITLYNPQENVMSSDEFFEYAKERNVGTRGDLITEVLIPKPPQNSYSEFQSLTLIENEKCQLNLASYFEWTDNGTILTARLIVSGATSFPTRLMLEETIEGKQIDESLISECVDAVLSDVDIIPNYKSSKDYRGEMFQRLSGRDFESISKTNPYQLHDKNSGGERMIIPVTINGKSVELNAEPGEFLLDVLRKEGYFGVKRGCSEGSCGACVILINNLPRKCCIMFAGQVRGMDITTIEGLGTPDNPHPIQDMFVEEGAAQCGYCIPGMIMSANALLLKNPDPSEDEIKEGLAGNLCRCTGYVKQLSAVRKAAEIMRGQGGRD